MAGDGASAAFSLVFVHERFAQRPWHLSAHATVADESLDRLASLCQPKEAGTLERGTVTGTEHVLVVVSIHGQQRESLELASVQLNGAAEPGRHVGNRTQPRLRNFDSPDDDVGGQVDCQPLRGRLDSAVKRGFAIVDRLRIDDFIAGDERLPDAQLVQPDDRTCD